MLHIKVQARSHMFERSEELLVYAVDHFIYSAGKSRFRSSYVTICSTNEMADDDAFFS